jgi:hypothetical protein
MDRNAHTRREIAHTIARLLNELTASGTTPEEPAFIFRIIDASSREVVDSAPVDDVTARAITSDLAAMTDELATQSHQQTRPVDSPPSQPGPKPELNPEQAAQVLYQALTNLGPDTDRALMATLRLPNGAYIGDVWLSEKEVADLSNGAMAIADRRRFIEAAEQRLLSQVSLTADEDAITALGDEAEAFLKNGGQL